jgi:hypothetical protein
MYLTMLSSTGNRILAHVRLLVNSVNTALNRMTTKIIVISDAPTINLRKVAIVPDRYDA